MFSSNVFFVAGGHSNRLSAKIKMLCTLHYVFFEYFMLLHTSLSFLQIFSLSRGGTQIDFLRTSLSFKRGEKCFWFPFKAN